MGQAGDDIIDGDKWLDVQIGVFAAGDTEHAGPPVALHKSMTTLAASMFNGTINPGQLRHRADDPEQHHAGAEYRDRRQRRRRRRRSRPCSPAHRAEYDITFNPNGHRHRGPYRGLGDRRHGYASRNIEVLGLHRPGYLAGGADAGSATAITIRRQRDSCADNFNDASDALQ